jgi:hypothetical protein
MTKARAVLVMVIAALVGCALFLWSAPQATACAAKSPTGDVACLTDGRPPSSQLGNIAGEDAVVLSSAEPEDKEEGAEAAQDEKKGESGDEEDPAAERLWELVMRG